MHHAPEEYDEYWAGAVRIAAGVLFALGVRRVVQPMVELPILLATLFGWVVFALSVFVGAFVASLGLARIVAEASS